MGGLCRVEYSTNAQTWTTRETEIPGNGETVARFYFDDAPGPRYFLRARSNP